jgi:Protein of unknown function (DUF4197)
MKKLLVLLAASILFTTSCETLSKLPGGMGGDTLSEGEAGDGIKGALAQGITNAVLKLNKEDGFFGDALYKVLLPPDAKKIENTLRNLGMGNMVDKAILQINRAAEDAVGTAKPIFVDAIKQMTLMDALNIVRGSKDAATNYFKEKTTQKLVEAFSPIIKASLDKLNATKYYSDVVTTYNNFPTTLKKINPDLPSFVVGKATDALFDLVAKEEANIRENPLARTTDILKKVFGKKW